MSPINWFILFIYFNIILYFTIVKIYFLTNFYVDTNREKLFSASQILLII